MSNNHTYNLLPQVSAAHIAGYCTEVAAWRLLCDVSAQVLSGQVADLITPQAIGLTDEGGFAWTTVPPPADRQKVYSAPEAQQGAPNEAAHVWSLAATVFYLIMGCDLMNGKGGSAQHAHSKVPYLRSEMPILSELVQQCLDFTPQKRPTMEQVEQQAQQQYTRCMETVKRGPRYKQATPQQASSSSKNHSIWPEEMVSSTL